MESDWTTIGEIADVYDGPHATPTKIETGPYFLSISSLTQGKLDLSLSAHLSESDYKKWTKRVTPTSGDVLFSYETRIGEAALMPDNIKACLGRRMGLLRPDRNKVIPRYLLYAYLSPTFQNEIRARTINGCTVDRIALTELPTFPIQIPKIEEQKAITHILGTIDDKIDLNQKMNRTLERIARAIYKSWFVDFDPIKAKIEGQKPFGMAEGIAALFPNSFEDSETGEIPKGWSPIPMDKTIQLIGGGTPKTKIPEYWGGEIPWFSVVDAPEESNVFVLATQKTITELGVEKSSTKILPEETTIISARGTVGKCALVGTPMAMNQSCYGIQGKDGRSSLHTYFAVRTLVSHLQKISHGSVFDTITRKTFSSVKVVNIPVPLTIEYDRKVRPLLKKIKNNLLENKTLAQIRDTLLPKLLSGEIQISSAEKILEKAV